VLPKLKEDSGRVSLRPESGAIKGAGKPAAAFEHVAINRGGLFQAALV
jgi:hypothetical protein